ncbi:MAG: HAD-IC family P-type ATPase [Bradymonadaceae bacterium]
MVQSADAEFLVGDDIEGLEAQGRDERRERLLDTEILARVTPQQKLTLIHLLQDAGEVVAMTGDGVNDAPALQNADIGVAMGQRGTEVAREASDMILLDDAFPTIVEAVERGRAIIENIRKFVVYLISGNIGEIALVGTAAVLGVTLPLLPLQILYLNVLNDVFPALALGVGPASAFVMDRPPTSGDTTVLDAEDWWEVVGFGLLIAVAVGTAFWVALGPMGWTTERAVTVSFLAVSTTRLLHVFNMRDPSSGPFDNEVTRNGYVWGALALDLLLLLAAVHVPVLSGVLSLTPPGTDGWLLVGASALAPLIVGQFYLRVRRLADE